MQTSHQAYIPKQKDLDADFIAYLSEKSKDNGYREYIEILMDACPSLSVNGAAQIILKLGSYLNERSKK